MSSDLHQRLTSLGDEAGRVFTRLLDPAPPAGPGPLAGLCVSVKDNIDVAGITTTAASQALRGNAPAAEDAPVVVRLRAAGASVFAKTTMSEFAYSTHGINPYFGTPANPHPFADGPRIPGGSSSGAAVAVALGLGDAAIGTDTAGSARIPAALCGVVGLKPRQRRIPLAGVVPLSHSLDCVGVLATSVARVAQVFSAIADPAPEQRGATVSRRADSGFTLLVPIGEGAPTAGPHDESVLEAFRRALERLEGSGRYRIVRAAAPCLDEAWLLSSEGGLSAPEAYAFHAPLLAKSRQLYDPFTLYRLGFGERCSADRYQRLLARRRELIAQAAKELAPYDAVIFPTCPIVAPPIAALADPAVKAAVNAQLLRHTIGANVLDLASITVPCAHLHPRSEGPVGLSLDGASGEEALLGLAQLVESDLSRVSGC